MMGNLARATYLDTTDHIWPFSTNVCNENTRHSQKINACNDNPDYGMQPNRRRGALEIGKRKLSNRDCEFLILKNDINSYTSTLFLRPIS